SKRQPEGSDAASGSSRPARPQQQQAPLRAGARLSPPRPRSGSCQRNGALPRTQGRRREVTPWVFRRRREKVSDPPRHSAPRVATYRGCEIQRRIFWTQMTQIYGDVNPPECFLVKTLAVELMRQNSTLRD